MEYVLHILVVTEFYTILTLSLDIIIGYAGLPAFGHIAFVAIGAYTSSLLAIEYGISPWIGLILGGLLASLLGALICMSSMRLKDDYFAIATFGFGIIIYEIANNWTGLTRGPFGIAGIPRLSFMGSPISGPGGYLSVVTIFLIVTVSILWRVLKSPFGKVLTAIREDELAAKSLGKNTLDFKLKAFMLGAFFAAVGGSLYAHFMSYINPSSFSPMESIIVLLMVVFGGMGTLIGSFLGASVLVLFPELLRFVGMPDGVAAPVRQIVYGLMLVILMVKRPQGIIGKYHWRQM